MFSGAKQSYGRIPKIAKIWYYVVVVVVVVVVKYWYKRGEDLKPPWVSLSLRFFAYT